MTSSPLRIEAVVFDFGGVIVDSPFAAFSELERRSGVAPDAVREINMRNPDDNAWAQIERGEIDVDEFARRFEAEAAACGHVLDGRDVIEIVSSNTVADTDARPVMLDAIRRCRGRGLALGLITNNIRPMGDKAAVGWIFETFDVVVESCLVGVRKPERAIYEQALTALDVEAANAVMLDDLGINLKSARALGMTTIKVGDPDVAVAELDALLVR